MQLSEKPDRLNVFQEHLSLSDSQALIITSSFRAATELDMGLGGCSVSLDVSEESLPSSNHLDQNFQLCGNRGRAGGTFPAFLQMVFQNLVDSTSIGLLLLQAKN